MALTVLGSGDLGGTYVLRIEVKRAIQVCFGRFMDGQLIDVPAGIYVYVGSALGSDRRLGQRLGRHITRREQGPDPIIRHEIMNVFGKGMFPKSEKKLLWHIDYLLDQSELCVTDILAIRRGERLESKIAELLMAEGEIIAGGLGASDAKGYTHLLKVSSGMNWWASLKVKIQDFADL